jgi:hypothetical protein
MQAFSKIRWAIDGKGLIKPKIKKIKKKKERKRRGVRKNLIKPKYT